MVQIPEPDEPGSVTPGKNDCSPVGFVWNYSVLVHGCSKSLMGSRAIRLVPAFRYLRHILFTRPYFEVRHDVELDGLSAAGR